MFPIEVYCSIAISLFGVWLLKWHCMNRLWVFAIWILSTTILFSGIGFHEQLLTPENSSFMTQEVCSFLLMTVTWKEYTYHYRMCFIKKWANGSSLKQNLACLCRHPLSTLIATAASASLNFTLNWPVLRLKIGQERGTSQWINDGKRTYSFFFLPRWEGIRHVAIWTIESGFMKAFMWGMEKAKGKELHSTEIYFISSSCSFSLCYYSVVLYCFSYLVK